MAGGQSKNTLVVRNARQALDQFKQEVASELGISNYQGYLGDLPSRINGAVGGHMVRRMIAAAEQSLIDQTSSQVSAQFRSSLQTSGSTQGTTGYTSGSSLSTPNWSNPSHT